MANWYNLPHRDLSHPSVTLLLRSLRINNTTPPTKRGVFSLKDIKNISNQCQFTNDPPLFRAIYLTAFFGFLRISNISPHSYREFDPLKHPLRSDIIFRDPGVHMKIKWTKTLQDQRAHHWDQLPKMKDTTVCPVLALYTLLHSRPLNPDQPLFVDKNSRRIVLDTKIRDTLREILTRLNIDPQGHGFHAFRRSGATLAYDLHVPLENIMHHGLWRSSSVWTYLQQTSNVSRVADTFQKRFS